MEQQTTCPIWGTPATEVVTSRDGRLINSPRAGGRFFISGTAAATVAERDELLKVRLTSWLIEQRRLGEHCPEIDTHTLDEAAKRRMASVDERADALLRYLATRSDLLGTVVKFYGHDNSKDPTTADELLAWTNSRKISEVITLVEYSASEKWLAQSRSDTSNPKFQIMLTPRGYARVAKLDAQGTASTQAFVAMWFDPSMNDAYDQGIAPAIRDAGFEPLRIDAKHHNNKIDDEIIAELRRSRFVVADFTQGPSGARGGVYYEAGFAHGLGIPVIFTCAASAIGAVHFDTRQYNHIVWKDAADLRRQLSHRISATIGDGPARASGGSK